MRKLIKKNARYQAFFHSLVCLYNTFGLCSLWGRNCIFRYNLYKPHSSNCWMNMYICVSACLSSITRYIFNEPNKVQTNKVQTNETHFLCPVHSFFGDKQTQGSKWYVSHGEGNEDKSVYFLMIILLCILCWSYFCRLYCQYLSDSCCQNCYYSNKTQSLHVSIGFS